MWDTERNSATILKENHDIFRSVTLADMFVQSDILIHIIFAESISTFG